MKVNLLMNPISSRLSAKFTTFERHFTYPLGKNRQFRINHGTDYNAFYRAMGQAHTFYMEKKDEIVAVIGAAIKKVVLPDKGKITLAYIGDLKIIPHGQRGRMVLELLKAIYSLLEAKVDLAYCVVMDGTKVSPSRYTGKAGIPALKPVAKHTILRIYPRQSLDHAQGIDENKGWTLFSRLSGNIYPSIPDYHLRSIIRPYWISGQETAVGMLEDTRKAKRLYLDDGKEMISSHLSYFAFSKNQSAKNVLLEALKQSEKQKFHAMFVALSERQYETLIPYITAMEYESATATVYSTEPLPDHYPINTAEI